MDILTIMADDVPLSLPFYKRKPHSLMTLTYLTDYFRTWKLVHPQKMEVA